MNERRGPRTWLRSAAALLAGFIVVVALSLGTDTVLRATGIFSSSGHPMSGGLFLLAAAYRSVYAIAGSYITARLAPNRPMQHALAGGAIGLLLSIAGAVATWDRAADFGPHWYPLALIATAMPCAWIGGRLRVLQLRNQPSNMPGGDAV